MKAEHGRPPTENAQPTPNTRVVKVMQLPDFKKKWAGRIALGLAIIFVIVAIIINRVSSSRANALAAAERLGSAELLVRDIRTRVPTASEPLDDKYMNRLKADADAVRTQLDDTVSSSSDPKILAQAAILRGDLNLALAHVPRIPGAATRPALELPDSREVLTAHAADAYKEVLEKYSDQPLNMISAHFGLAAIDEDKNDWESAKKHYQAIVSANFSPAKTALAQERMNALSRINQSAFLLPGPTTALVTPTTQPSTTEPGAQNTSTTQPAAVPGKGLATKPAIKPATGPSGNPSNRK